MKQPAMKFTLVRDGIQLAWAKRKSHLFALQCVLGGSIYKRTAKTYV